MTDISKDTILRAWREEGYAESLPEDVRKAIPARPKNDDGTAMSDSELEAAAGGTLPVIAAAAGVVGGSGAVGIGVGEGIDALTD